MSDAQESQIVAALITAEREVARGLAAGWYTVDGVSAAERLARLQEQLRTALQSAESGERLDGTVFAGVVRWVTDWIPDVDDPLVAALGQVERVTQSQT